ncbi:GMC family oxidoreductase [Verminephrobacter aporrectodeae]|uniref:GMC family oxidoreductase n=1 Tax=Verminephrobacter aporrectodeae TaxID=1110389 RepID=UPI002239072A|nr:GMC family oxidoreductase N-terminal domain-containing protein [Verminephrobacter aporrectodeae]MCW5257523.1 choline dehydrogenase [Verminephrobacter aporrectodeae subsp. tuberculatae]MCW8177663.1 choline dehydrogenase [Verminephrobacter aporrectodeae subsp. tuberculatae]MCW8204903.1 choline dehydrogenase [Verminephrobacter aporrectodeae subsp. tuberculatae]
MSSLRSREEFDFLVLGGGSAGCVVASRLSEEQDCSVAMFEAGSRDRLRLTSIPSAQLFTIGKPQYDWCYKSEPDPTRHGASELWPRGRMLGGSSGINGMVFIRGCAADYDEWERLGNSGWGWDSVLPLFKRIESSDIASELRGTAGPQTITTARWRHPLSLKFIESAAAAGLPYNNDMNGISHEGMGWSQGTIKNGRRQSAFDAYIVPNLRRPNLFVRENMLVQRIVFDGRRAVGAVVSDQRGGDSWTIRARRGVIVCAGTINTPQLLMLSGVGPGEELQAVGIEVKHHSPAVGKNLMEHAGLRLQAEMDQWTLNRYVTPWWAPIQALRCLAFRSGPVSSPTAQLLGFCRSDPELENPDLEILFFAFGSRYGSKKHGTMSSIPNRNLVTMLVTLNHPASKGHVALKDADPRSPIEIHPRMLSAHEDVERLRRGLHILRRIASTPPFSDSVVELLDFPSAEASEADEEGFIRKATCPFYHPAGTSRMGADQASVVDPKLAVRGVDCLWVADASVFPKMVSGNIHATTLMIGEKAAELIRTAAV